MRSIPCGPRSRQQGAKPVQIVGGELACLDLEAIVPVAPTKPLHHVAPRGEQPGFPLVDYMAILVKHQRGIIVEISSRAPQVNAATTGSRYGPQMQPGNRRMLDYAHVPNTSAEESLERSLHMRR